MFRTIDELLKTLPAQEIQFHAPRQEARRVLDATGSTVRGRAFCSLLLLLLLLWLPDSRRRSSLPRQFERSAKSMHDRMKKHFSVSPKTLPVAWKRLVEFARERLPLYEKLALECYQLRFEPPPQRAIEMLNKFATST